MKKFSYVLAVIGLLTSFSLQAAAPGDLPKVPFGGKDDPNFAGNCRAITKMVNGLMGYTASTCKATRGIVMIKATRQVEANNEMLQFYVNALVGSGWAVNEGYYGSGADFVVGNDNGKYGCKMLSGSVAAYRQDRVKNKGGDHWELGLMLNDAKKVECPDFLKSGPSR